MLPTARRGSHGHPPGALWQAPAASRRLAVANLRIVTAQPACYLKRLHWDVQSLTRNAYFQLPSLSAPVLTSSQGHYHTRISGPLFPRRLQDSRGVAALPPREWLRCHGVGPGGAGGAVP